MYQKNIFLSRIPAILVSIVPLVVVIIYFIFGYKYVLAEYTFNNSLKALASNNGIETYKLMQKAITLNPKVDRYRASFAQVNFALANSIAQSKKQGELTDEDKNNINTLIQQSIQEGKASVILNNSRSGSWELLASIYKSLMPFAQGAENFAIQTYQQAIALDPTNPNLRIALGGVYYALGNYDEAIRSFELAVTAKTDLANAHYNLATAYNGKGDTDKAINQLTITMSLVDRDSQDYELVKKELENLESKKPSKKAAEGTDNLQPPKPAEEPIIKPPLELPADAEPPVETNTSNNPQETPLP